MLHKQESHDETQFLLLVQRLLWRHRPETKENTAANANASDVANIANSNAADIVKVANAVDLANIAYSNVAYASKVASC